MKKKKIRPFFLTLGFLAILFSLPARGIPSEYTYDLSMYANARLLSGSSDSFLELELDEGNPLAEIITLETGIVQRIDTQALEAKFNYRVEIKYDNGHFGRYYLNRISTQLQPGRRLQKDDLIGFQGEPKAGNTASFRIEVSPSDRSMVFIDLQQGLNTDPFTRKLTSLSNSPLFHLKVPDSELCIDIPNGSQQIGKEMGLWPVNWGENQMWYLIKRGDYYQIKSEINELSLSVATDSTNGKTILVQSHFTDSDLQLWEITKENERLVSIRSKSNGNLLTVNKDRSALFFPNQTDANSLWEIAEVSSSRILTPSAMKEDVDFYFRTVEQTHPHMYAYTCVEVVDSAKKELIHYTEEPRLYRDFFRKISENNRLFDGHTHIYRSGFNTRDTERYRNYGGLFFPYSIQYDGERILLCDTADKKKIRGEIVSLNTVPAARICATLNKVWNFENTGMNHRSIEYSFSVNIHSYLGIRGPWFEIKLQIEPDTPPQVLIVKGITLPEFYKDKGYFGRRKDYSMKLYEDESIALIEYNTCPMGASIPALKRFMEESFREIREKDIKHVFIDITRNGGGGGDEVNIHLYNQLNHEAHNWKSIRHVKRNNPERIDTIPVLQCTETIQDGYPYTVYLVQSCLTYSAAVGISAWFKFTGRGIILGEETGGTTAAYVYTPHFEMPHSQIGFRVSNTLWTFPYGARIDQGILPDIPVKIDFNHAHYAVEDLKYFISLSKNGSK